MKLGRIVIAGGTGLIGTALVEYFIDYSDDIVVLSRGKEGQHKGYRSVQWDGNSTGAWQNEIDGSEVLINLSGKSIQCRFTEENKKVLRASRLQSTDILRQTVQDAHSPPRVWMNSSGTGIYPKGEGISSENTTETADDFLGQLCIDWEAAFFDDTLPTTRRVALRTSPVLSANGGMFSPIKMAAQFGGGGKQGDGKQWFSWIHIDDLVRGIHFIIHEESMAGPVNMCSPSPVRNNEFMSAVRSAIGIPFGLPTPAFLLKLVSPLIGVEPSLALDSIRVVPKRLSDSDFLFEHSEIKEALQSIV